jgi:novobiocin biosynthesis protein NovU/D-mycarose 3-C-methyltransferase
MLGVYAALAPNGVALIEVPYVGNLLNTLAFDTVYHEHLSYWSVTALAGLCCDVGLVLTDVTYLPTHGGSMRATIAQRGTPSQAVEIALAQETHVLKPANYMQFGARVSRLLADINTELVREQPYIGFGAAAKTTVLLNSLDVRAYPSVVYDDVPTKQGLCIPGTKVRIEAPPKHFANTDIPIVVFAWNYAPEIIKRLRREGFAYGVFVPDRKLRWHTED